MVVTHLEARNYRQGAEERCLRRGSTAPYSPSIIAHEGWMITQARVLESQLEPLMSDFIERLLRVVDTVDITSYLHRCDSAQAQEGKTESRIHHQQNAAE